jgi:hypothetical protein
MVNRMIAVILVLCMIMTLGGCGNKNTNSGDNNEVTEPSENITDEVVNIEDPDNVTENPVDKLTEEEQAQIAYEQALKDRAELEEIRKQDLGEFYIPLPPVDFEVEKVKIDAKGLFSTGSTAGKSVDIDDIESYKAYIEAVETNNTAEINRLSPTLQNLNTLEKIIGIAAATEINAVVIDVKDDSGLLTYESSLEIVNSVDANRSTRIKDVGALLEILDKYDIYPIARIVTFKDRNFAYAKPDYSIQLKNGGVWHDYSGTPWVNPFDKHVWDYNVAIAKEAALLGFKEIQFDYVRFPDNARAYNPITNFPGREGRQKDEAIGDFLEYAKVSLEDYGVNIGADVFGLITRTWDDYPEDIGQSWIEIAPYVDYVCPMSYPSHYGADWYGYEVPDAHPYGVIRGSMMEALEKNSAVAAGSSIRPWLQDFTATWVPGHIYYGYTEVRQQIIAAKELGIDSYMIWNSSNVYDPKSFMKSAAEKGTTYPVDMGDEDFRGRTPMDAMYEYFKAERHKRFSQVFILTPVEDRTDNFDVYYDEMTTDKYDLIDYDTLGYEVSGDTAKVTVYYKYQVSEGETTKYIENNQDVWNLVKEEGIWKVIRDIKEVKIEDESSQTSEATTN